MTFDITQHIDGLDEATRARLLEKAMERNAARDNRQRWQQWAYLAGSTGLLLGFVAAMVATGMTEAGQTFQQCHRDRAVLERIAELAKEGER